MWKNILPTGLTGELPLVGGASAVLVYEEEIVRRLFAGDKPGGLLNGFVFEGTPDTIIFKVCMIILFYLKL